MMDDEEQTRKTHVERLLQASVRTIRPPDAMSDDHEDAGPLGKVRTSYDNHCKERMELLAINVPDDLYYSRYVAEDAADPARTRTSFPPANPKLYQKAVEDLNRALMGPLHLKGHPMPRIREIQSAEAQIQDAVWGHPKLTDEENKEVLDSHVRELAEQLFIEGAAFNIARDEVCAQEMAEKVARTMVLAKFQTLGLIPPDDFAVSSQKSR